jgi:glycosyltransferase involved in cell wall biosynthesis
MAKPRCLAVCLFYNDDDIVEDAIKHLLENNHELVVWDHGSSDRTAEEIDKFNPYIRERHFLPRSFDFFKLFEHVSRYVIDNYAAQYDWISFPESDEILEGPDRKKSYYEHVCDVVESPYDWVQFNNMVYWFTDEDFADEPSPRMRIRRYSIWADCLPRVYAWRARCMNVREFNHNPARGNKYPAHFNTCHYQMRSERHMLKRIESRVGLRQGRLANAHFDFMEINKDKLYIPTAQLHFDDGISELSRVQTLNWRDIYGNYDMLMEQLKASGSKQST